MKIDAIYTSDLDRRNEREKGGGGEVESEAENSDRPVAAGR